MDNAKALEVLQKMHDEKVADAESKEGRVAQLNAEYEAGDHDPDTVAAIERFTKRGVISRVEADALQVAIELFWKEV